MRNTSGAHRASAPEHLHEGRNPARTGVLFRRREVEHHIGLDERSGRVVDRDELVVEERRDVVERHLGLVARRGRCLRGMTRQRDGTVQPPSAEDDG